MPNTPEHLCLTCGMVNWNKTANGRVHPNGQGRCAWTPPYIPTPAAWNWGVGFGESKRQPRAGWSHIERKPRTPITECETYGVKV